MAASDRRTIDAQVRLRRDDGEYRWFQLRAVPTCDDDDRLTGWVGTCTDIDDSCAKLARRIDSVCCSTRSSRRSSSSTPRSHVIDEVNRGACELVGRTRRASSSASASRPSSSRPRPARVPADRRPARRPASARRRRSCSTTCGRDGRPISVEVVAPAGRPARRHARRSSPSPATSASGSRSRSVSSASPRPSMPGRPSSMRSSGRWARRSSCAPPTARSRLTNPAGERLFPDVDERTYAEILDQLNDPDGRRAAPSDALGGPVELRTRDGSATAGSSSRPTRSTSGSAVAPSGDETIVVMRDVTEARRREAVRETFIGVLSHELRTPVTTIFGGAKLLAARAVDARRGDDARDLPRHPRRGRAAPAAGRGRGRAQPLRRGGRRDRRGAGPPPAPRARGSSNRRRRAGRA